MCQQTFNVILGSMYRILIGHRQLGRYFKQMTTNLRTSWQTTSGKWRPFDREGTTIFDTSHYDITSAHRSRGNKSQSSGISFTPPHFSGTERNQSYIGDSNSGNRFITMSTDLELSLFILLATLVIGKLLGVLLTSSEWENFELSG